MAGSTSVVPLTISWWCSFDQVKGTTSSVFSSYYWLLLKRKPPAIKTTSKTVKPSKLSKKNLFDTPTVVENSSESEENFDFSSDESELNFESEIKEFNDELQFEDKELEKGGYILVNISTKKISKHFVAHVMSLENDTAQVQYLKKIQGNKFILEDHSTYDIDLQDVVAKLPNPAKSGGSARQRECLNFGVDFSSYKVE